MDNSDATSGGNKTEFGLISMSMVGSIVTAIIAGIQPLLQASIEKATTRVIREQLGASEFEPVKVKSAIQSQKWEMDALEQYSRRDNIKIFGIAEPAQNGEENTNQLVMDLGKKVGVDISPGDISVSHRVRGGGSGPRPIVAKFVRRDTKSLLMRSKRKLKDVAEHADKSDNGKGDGVSKRAPQIFINDDITALRGKLLREVKRDQNVERAYTLDGRIHCILKQKPGNGGQHHGREQKIVIENPDDLFKLGWSEDQMRGTNLFLDF